MMCCGEINRAQSAARNGGRLGKPRGWAAGAAAVKGYVCHKVRVSVQACAEESREL